MASRRVVAILLLVGTYTAHGQTPDLSLTVGVGWDLSIRVGVEYRFHPRFGVKADIGTSVFALLEGDFAFVADLLGTIYFTAPGRRFLAGCSLGVPDFVLLFIEGSPAMCSFGGVLFAGYRFGEVFALKARLGAGFPIFHEAGRWETRQMPVWPDFVVESVFRLR